MIAAGDRVYLDWNATAPLRPAAREAMLAAMALPGNPSSIHAEGRKARALLEEARRAVADLVGADPSGVVFTSGGTEANVTALAPIEGARPTVPVLSAVEHPSVLAGGRFSREAIRLAPVDGDGVIDLAALAGIVEEVAAAGAVPLVALMLANNETGVVEPVAAAAEIAHAAGGRLHVDAVQAAGRIAVDLGGLGADMLALSGHKFGAPKGVGALILRPGLDPVPLVSGGGQEGRRRAGTENLVGIAGFGAAARAAAAGLAEMTRLERLRDWLEAALTPISGATVVFGRAASRLPNTSAFAVPSVRSETAVIALDLEGFAVSAGAACSSGKVAASATLAAMRVPDDLARGAIRVSLGWDTTEEEVARFAAAWGRVVERSGASVGRAA
jgi:cysteine desulfurase